MRLFGSVVVLVCLSSIRASPLDARTELHKDFGRVKRQNLEDKRAAEEKLKHSIWQNDYFNHLLQKQQRDRNEVLRREDLLHQKAKADLRNVFHHAKLARAKAAKTLVLEAAVPAKLAKPLALATPALANVAQNTAVLQKSPPASPPNQPAAAAATAAAAPPAATEPTSTTTEETTEVALRLPLGIFHKLGMFFRTYHVQPINMTDEEIAILERTTSTTTTTTKAPPLNKYVKVNVPESLFHRLWRFFKKYTLRRPVIEDPSTHAAPLDGHEGPIEEEAIKEVNKKLQRITE